jgi:hypothetical protein
MIPAEHGNEQFFDAAVRVPQRSLLRFATVVAMALAFTIPASAQIVQTPAQIVQTPALQVGKILGTVTDVKGDPVVGATVVLTGPDSTDRRTVVTPENGFFQFDDLKAASYQIVINADGFAEWTSPPIALEPGQVNLVGSITLRLATQNTTVHVTYDPVEIATEQVKLEETQRVLGIIPNFYVSYQRGEYRTPHNQNKIRARSQSFLRSRYDWRSRPCGRF